MSGARGPSAAHARTFGRRTELPKVTIRHGGTEKSFTVRPLLSAFVGFVGLGTVGLTIGAGGYMMMHDDVVVLLSKRMGAIEDDYQARVGSLRMQLDQAQSRSAIAEATLAGDVGTLLRRQDEIAARHEAVVRVIDMARRTEVVAATPPLPPKASRAATSEPLLQASLARTAFAPVDEGALRPGIAKAQRTIDLIAAEQDAVIDGITNEADAFLGSLRSAIADVPVPQTLRSELDASGGPYIPLARADDFASRAVRAELLLEAVSRVQAMTDHMPIRVPTKGRRSSNFGSRIDPLNGSPAFHAGLDYAAPSGTPVRATGAGRVIRAVRKGGYGLMIEIDHGGDLATRYAHLSRMSVKVGDRVVPGQMIGQVGSTGRSTGPHLHYETRRGGEPVNPVTFLKAGRKLAALLKR